MVSRALGQTEIAAKPVAHAWIPANILPEKEFITLTTNAVLNWKLDGAFLNHVYHLLNTRPPLPQVNL